MDPDKPRHPSSAPSVGEKALEEARRQLALLRRRLEVEEALERVRARAMAMRSSGELAEAATVMFREFRALTNIDTGTGSGCWISVIDEENEVSANWGTDFEGVTMQVSFHLPLTEHPVLTRSYAAWKRGAPLIVTDLSREAFVEYTQYIAGLLDFATDPVIRQALANPPERYVQY